MTVTCDPCGAHILTANDRWPGYCSQTCRDADRRTVQERRAERRARAAAQRAFKSGAPAPTYFLT